MPKRTLFTVGNFAPLQKPEGVSYRVDIGEDADELDSVTLALAEFLIVMGGFVWEVSLEGKVLVMKCLTPLDKERFARFQESIELSGYTAVNFDLPKGTVDTVMIQGALGHLPVTTALQ